MWNYSQEKSLKMKHCCLGPVLHEVYILYLRVVGKRIKIFRIIRKWTFSCQSTRINDLQFNSNNCCNFFCSRNYWKSISWVFRVVDYQILCVIIIFSCKEYQAHQRQNSWWGVAKFCYWIIFERETQLKNLVNLKS